MSKEILVSGLRASSKPHIGNYLGALRQFVELQDKYDSYFFVADLHAMTTPFEPKELRQHTMEVVADYLALGLDPNKCTLFLQSQIPEHLELAWIFNCITPLGELYRMTQFKEKAENKDKANAGLLNYPVLMAADVMLYKAQTIPVGEDQVQHIELARIIARKFNSKFGQTFPEPQSLLTKTSSRVKSLVDPEKKMSKSGDAPLFLSDTPEIISQKIKKAVTATDSSGKSAGVENLFSLLKEFGTVEEEKHFKAEQKAGTLKFSDLKETLAKDISEYFSEFREKRTELLSDPARIARVLADGADKARDKAQATMKEVKANTGLL